MLAAAIKLLGPARLRAAGLAYLGGGGLAAALGVAVLLLTPAGQIIQETVLEPVARALEQAIAAPTGPRDPAPPDPIADEAGAVAAVSVVSSPAQLAPGPSPPRLNEEPELGPTFDTGLQLDIIEVPTQPQRDQQIVVLRTGGTLIGLALAPVHDSVSPVPSPSGSASTTTMPAESSVAPPDGAIGSRASAIARLTPDLSAEAAQDMGDDSGPAPLAADGDPRPPSIPPGQTSSTLRDDSPRLATHRESPEASSQIVLDRSGRPPPTGPASSHSSDVRGQTSSHAGSPREDASPGRSTVVPRTAPSRSAPVTPGPTPSTDRPPSRPSSASSGSQVANATRTHPPPAAPAVASTPSPEAAIGQTDSVHTTPSGRGEPERPAAPARPTPRTK